MTTAKVEYDLIASSSDTCTNCIFEEPWYLDAVAPNQWEVATVKDHELVVARLPYVIKKRYGLRILGHPPLCQTLGPWYKSDSSAKYSTSLSHQKELANALISQLPKYDLFSQNFHPTQSYWLPYYWRGFRCAGATTYRLNLRCDLDSLWNGLDSSVRRSVRKASKELVVSMDGTAESFLRTVNVSLQRKNRTITSVESTFARLIDTAQKRNSGAILQACDSNGVSRAELFLVHDSRAAYYLMGGVHPEFMSSGAMSLLMWEAIRYSSGKSFIFDFEGSMDPGVERFFRSFGGVQTQLNRIHHFTRRLDWINPILNTLK